MVAEWISSSTPPVANSTLSASSSSPSSRVRVTGPVAHARRTAVTLAPIRTPAGAVQPAVPRISSVPVLLSQLACPSSFQPTTYFDAAGEHRRGVCRPGDLLARPRDPPGIGHRRDRPQHRLAGDARPVGALAPTSSRSTAATLSPAAPARVATVCPTGPAPSTITSYALSAGPFMVRVWPGLERPHRQGG